MTDTARTIHIINRVMPPNAGATGVLARDLADYLSRHGWRAHISACEHAHARTVWGQLRDMATLAWRALRAPRCDVVLSMTDPPMLAVLGAVAAWRHGSRHVHWCQDMYPDLLVLWRRMPAPVMKILNALMRAVYRRADGVVAIGRCMADRLRAAGAPVPRVRVIPNWLPQETIADTAMPAAPPTHDVLYAGTLGRAHPVAGVLDAAARLQAAGSDIRFVFAGGGAGRDALMAEAGRRGLNNFLFLPPQGDAEYSALCASAMAHLVLIRGDIAGCLVPSKAYAGFAHGRPVVFAGPAECEIALRLRERGGGVCVPPGDGRAIADALLLYAADAAAWRAGAQAARAMATEQNRTKSLALWHAAINEALTARPRATSIG